VANMSDLIFRGNIDETEVGQLAIGVPMKITIGALQNLQYNAILEYISPKATESNGANQFEIKAAVDLTSHSGHSDDAATLRSGYSANAEIVLDEADGVLSIPESGIEFIGDSTFVYLILPPVNGEAQYERRPVTTGLSDGVNIEVRSGLSLTDKVRGPQVITEEEE